MWIISANKSVKFQIKITSGCWEKSKKLYGSTLFCRTLYNYKPRSAVGFVQDHYRGHESLEQIVQDADEKVSRVLSTTNKFDANPYPAQKKSTRCHNLVLSITIDSITVAVSAINNLSWFWFRLKFRCHCSKCCTESAVCKLRNKLK